MSSKTPFQLWAGEHLASPLRPGSDTKSFSIHAEPLEVDRRTARIHFTSTYDPFIFVTTSPDDDFFPGGDHEFVVAFEGTTSKIPCSLRAWNSDADEFVLSPLYHPFFLGFEDQVCRSLSAQWIGFPRPQKMHFLNRREFSFKYLDDDWLLSGKILEAEGENSAPYNLENRDIQTGYATTIKCVNRDIDKDRANLIIHRLSSAFGFAVANFLPPVRVAGLDNNDNVVWLRLGSDLRSPRQGARWSDLVDGNDFDQFIKAYMSAASNEEHGDSLATCVFLYGQCAAALPSIRPSLLLGQAALEELAKYTLISEARLERTFVDKMSAYNLFDTFVAMMGLDKDQVAKAISRTPAAQDFSSAIKAITETRNAVTHAGQRRPDFQQVRDAWWSLSRLLEITILASIGYDGTLKLGSESGRVRFSQFFR